MNLYLLRLLAVLRLILLFICCQTIFTDSFNPRYSSSKYLSPLHLSIQQSTTHVSIAVLVEKDEMSFFKEKPTKQPVRWGEIFPHIREKLTWDGEDIKLTMIEPSELDSLDHILPDIVLIVGLEEKNFKQVSSFKTLKTCMLHFHYF